MWHKWNTKNKYYPATRWEAPTHWAQSSHRCPPAAKVLISPQKKVPTLRFRGNLGNKTKDKLDENINDKSGRCKNYLAEHKIKEKFKHKFRQIQNNNGPLSEQYGMVLSVSIAFASSTQGAQFPHQQQQSKSKSLLVS